MVLVSDDQLPCRKKLLSWHSVTELPATSSDTRHPIPDVALRALAALSKCFKADLNILPMLLYIASYPKGLQPACAH